MDRKTEFKWRTRQLRLRAAIFLRRNGLFLAAAVSLAAIGLAAAVLFTRSGDAPTPVSRSDDEQLADVTSPAYAHTAVPLPVGTEAAPSPSPAATPAPTFIPSPIPDFTPFPEETPDPALSQLQPPVDGSVIRVFAINSLIWSETLGQWMTHPGVDVTANKGDPVYAVLAGTVTAVYADDMLGTTVVIDHGNGLESVYSSLAEQPPVKEGDEVISRQEIGRIGDTALGECAERSHLHFELHYNGSPIDPAGMIVFNKN